MECIPGLAVQILKVIRPVFPPCCSELIVISQTQRAQTILLNLKSERVQLKLIPRRPDSGSLGPIVW